MLCFHKTHTRLYFSSVFNISQKTLDKKSLSHHNSAPYMIAQCQEASQEKVFSFKKNLFHFPYSVSSLSKSFSKRQKMPLTIFCPPLTPAYPPWISYQAMIHIELCMTCFNFSSVSTDIVFVHVVWGKFCKILCGGFLRGARFGGLCREIAETAIPRRALRLQKEKKTAHLM